MLRVTKVQMKLNTSNSLAKARNLDAAGPSGSKSIFKVMSPYFHHAKRRFVPLFMFSMTTASGIISNNNEDGLCGQDLN